MGGRLREEVIRNGKEVLIKDQRQEKAEGFIPFQTEGKKSACSILVTPIYAGGEIIGSLGVQHFLPGMYDQSHASLLGLLANAAGIAIENAKLYAQISQRIKEQTGLMNVSSVLRFFNDRETMLRSILEHTCNMLGTENAEIMLLDEQTGESVIEMATGDLRRFETSRFPAGKGTLTHLIKTGKPYYVPDITKDKRYFLLPGEPPVVKSMSTAPIIVEDKVIGAITVSCNAEDYLDHLGLLSSVADTAASVIHQAQLYAEVTNRVQQLDVVYQMSVEIGSGLDFNQLISKLYQQCQRIGDTDTFYVALYDENTDLINFPVFIKEGKSLTVEPHKLTEKIGITRRIIKDRKTLYVPDIFNMPAKYEFVREEGIPVRSYVGVPLFLRDRVIGVFSIQSNKANAYTSSQIFMLELLSRQVVVAIQNSRLYQQAQEEISERKLITAELKESEEKYRHLAGELDLRVKERTAEIDATRQRLEMATHAGHLGIWERDLHAKHELWDDQMFVLFEVTKSPQGNCFEKRYEKILTEDLARLKEYDANAIPKNDGYFIDYRIVLGDGSTRTIQSQAAILPGDDGKPRYLIGVDRDITETKNAEEILKKANVEMERALRMKDEFLANMSHELRTPLNAILGISESLEEQITGSLNERQQKYVRTISESGRLLLSLINDILDLSKIEAGRMKLEVNDTELAPLIQSSVRLVKEIAHKKQIQINIKSDLKVSYVMSDERRLKQVFVNLLSNAVKFSKENSEIGIDVSGDINLKQVRIMVWDNGIGIAKSDIDRLFQPFSQLDAGLDREHSGTGLGLALVAQIIRLHGGRVEVESETGVGSKFSIILPWEPKEHTASVTAKPQRAERIMPFLGERQGKILIIEDTESVILFVKDYLEVSGFSVSVAMDGIDGVAKSKTLIPDLILMDIQMPGMDGFESLRQIRQDPHTRHIPVIAVTALAMMGDKERCLKAGFNEYISKPMSLKNLSQTIDKLLFSSRGESG